jgi:sn-glycerol 3-phosphate transport system ATP-binding protein
MSGFLEIKGLAKRFGSVSVLEKLDLAVKEGEFLVLVGPSGCGKSTILRLIAGLESPSEGAIFIDGRNVVGVEPKDRDIAFVFQSYALYPHMNVFENMAFGLRMARKFSEEEIRARVHEAAGLLQLEKYLERKPRELSGGQRQRVALGRALVRKPKVFLFDEPLSNLDAHLRNQMRVEIRKLQQKLGVTAVYVTHDQVEATTMGDRIAILQGGKLRQVGSPVEVYRRPADSFVAGFIGMPEMNFLEGKVEGGELKLGDFRMPVSVPEGAVKVGVRPEAVKLGEGAPAKVELVENLGAQALVHLRLPGGQSLRAVVANDRPPALGGDVKFQWAESAVHLFAMDEPGRALLAGLPGESGSAGAAAGGSP